MKSDLTRWNRAGLKRFRYVDGNAAIYLEALRQALFARLKTAGWDMELLDLKRDSDGDRKKALGEYIEEFGKDHQRALDNYLKLNDNRGSMAFEIIRSFARAAHVLTEHLDAYANEGYLGTATQWENVRRLVQGLDYHPNPPASAMTHLVLHAKPGQSGLVEQGLQIKHTPEKGSPVVFETLEDIQVDPTLNALRLKGWNINETPLSGNHLTLENTEVARKLRQGQAIVIEQETPIKRSCKAQVQTVTINEKDETAVVTLASALPDDEYLIGSTVIHANVVTAGHGETQPERILGSGNATLSHQEFLFPMSNVSFVPDSTQVSGVRADIRVIVDGGEPWTQVSRFNQSRPTDLHYTVRMTEAGYLRVVFGDGVNGRRLPTGENNVRIAWRMGSGLAGNLDADSLKKLAHPHPRIEAIDQPLCASGGNDMESVTSLRSSAPASLMTMERAVSVKDFAALAASHSSVWSAHAELESSGRVVRVIVVPAQGGSLEPIAQSLKAFLQSHALPGVGIKLEGYKSEILELDITLGIDSARFEPDAVQAEVESSLLQRFALENRAIGAPVYLSDVYQCVEAVRGVEYSVCKFKEKSELSQKPHPSEQFRKPDDPNGVLHMNAKANIQLAWEGAQ